jgi:hypothetical protein
MMPENGMAADAPMPGALGELQQASSEEQAVYDEFVGQAMNMVYDERMMPGVLEMLKGGGDPMEGLAEATSMVTARVATAAIQAGQKLSGDVLLHAGTEIFEDLAELSKRAGIKDYGEDQDAFEGAYFRALDKFRTLAQGDGRLNQQAMQQDLEKLMEMDQSGELEAMLRDLDEKNPRGNAGQPEPEPEPEPELAGGLGAAMGRA